MNKEGVEARELIDRINRHGTTAGYENAPLTMDEARVLVRALSDSVRWINTDERTPDNEQTVLGYWPEYKGREAVYESVKYHAKDAPDSGEAWRSAFGEDTDRPDCWQPLPNGPK